MSAGWSSASFEDCVAKVTYTTKIPRKDFLEDGPWPIVSQEEGLINGYWDNEADLFRVTTPLVVFGDHTRIFKFVDFDFVLGADGVKVLQPREFLLPKFFFYQLLAADLKSLGYSRHYRLLRDLEIGYPSRSEQHRIVSVLDEAFGAIAMARANTEQNLRNARDAYERDLDALFAEGAERWDKRRVGDLAETVTKGTTPTSIGFSFEPDGPVNFVKVEAISAEGTIRQERLARISVECHEALRRSQLRENDVLFSIAGALGRTAIVGAELLPANTNQALAIIRLKPSIDVLPEFLVRALATSVTAAQTDLLRAGAAQQNLSLAQLRSFEVPVPTRSEQERIVEHLRGVRTLTLGLTRVFDQKLVALDALKQSLLHQAFTGAL